MVSLRCKMIVKQELQQVGLHFVNVDLGTIEILENISDFQRGELSKNLRVFGLELLDDKRKILIEKIKAVIIEMIHYTDELPKVNYSDDISEKLGYDYTYLANTFSEVKRITIQPVSYTHRDVYKRQAFINAFAIGSPLSVLCRIVSSNKIAPPMLSFKPGVVTMSSRYLRLSLIHI